MGIFSSSASITCYRVEGQMPEPIIDAVEKGLSSHRIRDIDNEPLESAVGWTAFTDAFRPDFDGASFSIGTYLVFSLRIDKKSIPAKVLKKHVSLAVTRRLTDSGREYLSRNEKSEIREQVLGNLYQRIPATPNVYDVLWSVEDRTVWFFSNLKAANEELETLFTKSFKLTLIRMFPFTIADLATGLSETERDVLAKLSPTRFTD